jgi:penicillin amidase
VRDVAEAFVAGINAYVAETRRGEKPLPAEFKLTGSQPEEWKAEDVVRIRSHALISNIGSEVERAHVACKAGLDADRLRVKLEPPHTVVVPKGLDPCAIPEGVMKEYELATAAVRFTPDAVKKLALVVPDGAQEGSNNWVISPSHSTTGRAVLANDPHRRLTLPSLRYIVHLDAPGLSVIGAGEPAQPGVSLGHNGHVAFGLTIFDVDQEDLYVYSLKPGEPESYRYGGGWERMQAVHETIEVKGERAREVTLQFTRHGPVLVVDAAKGRAFAVRSVWSEPGTAAYLASSWMLGVRSWKDFQNARDRWGTPPLNLVYADVAGNIGWAPGARTPVRTTWDGLLPVPGDGRYEWQGFLAGHDLPSKYNPAQGWIATANEMNLPADSRAHRVGFEWADRSRITRIQNVLGGSEKLSLADSMALQTDGHNEMSRSLTPLLEPLSSTDPMVTKAMALLRAWDHDEPPSSVEAAIYEVWTSHYLGRMTVARATPAAVHQLIGNGDLEAVIDLLRHPDARLGADPRAARDQLLLESLSAAVSDLKQRFGPDMTTWKWGRLHRMTFEAAVAKLADPALRAKMSLQPVELRGSAASPAAAYYDEGFSVISGASVRIVLDVGDWDRSMAINSPGESGDPSSAHYSDLLPLWAQGKYVPLLFSREAVEKAAEVVLSLTPAP